MFGPSGRSTSVPTFARSIVVLHHSGLVVQVALQHKSQQSPLTTLRKPRFFWVNHALITEQALAYRNRMVADSFTAGRFDPKDVAALAVECADPVIDTAIRRIATAWVDSGLPPEQLGTTWEGPAVDNIFHNDVTLLDAMDDIIKAVHRAQFSRPRQRVASFTGAVRF